MATPAPEEKAGRVDSGISLVVDMDGTLLKGDSTWEMLVQTLLKRPLTILQMLRWMLRGRAEFKARLAQSNSQAVLPPVDPDVLAYIRQAKAAGQQIILATGAHETIASRVSKQLGLFDRTFASDNRNNLTGTRKLSVLKGELGDKPFIYIGNSSADLPVWEQAHQAILVRTPPRVKRRLLRKKDAEQVSELVPPVSRLRVWVNALRIHQWVKGFLVFLPIFLSHRFTDFSLWMQGFLAFAAIGSAASAHYLLNDMADLDGDRQHPTKRQRALASSELSIPNAVLGMALLLGLAFVCCIPLGPMASLLVGGYFVLSSIYTLYLKTKLGIDVVLLSVFHTGRIVLGGVAMDIEISKWTLIFSIFFFTTIALTKRISELVRHIEGQPGRSRRGYFKADLEILGAHAAGSGLVASLTVVLYISSTEAALLYRRPEWLWFICFLQMYWTFRLLILSRRGHLSEDPTLFAWKDRATWTCWFAVLLIGWLAK